MLEQNHDFEELKQSCEICDMKIANFHPHGKKINFDRNIHKTRKRCTEKTKLEMREHYMLMQNYAATAKEFGVNESTVRTIVKTATRNSLLTFDAFSAHKTDDVQSKLVESKSDILMIPLGCTSKCQPMDVCINKPFQVILRKCWVTYISKIIEQLSATTPDDFKLPPPSRQDMVDWVEEAHRLISSDKDMEKRSFDVCGITTSDPAKVRSGSFYDKCMRNVKSVIEANELEDEDPFEL